MLPLVLHEAVLAGQVEATARLVLTGFDRITPAQQHLIEAFREHGHEVEMAEPAEVSTAETALLVEAVDKRDEIATCALWVQQRACGRRSADRARIAVVVPSVSSVRPEIERIFRQILAPEAVAIGAHDLPLPFEFSLGVPLADVPMARSALLLLRWMNEPLLQDQVSWLLLSGFLCEQQDELLPIAEFDVKLRRQPMRQPEQDLDTFLQFCEGCKQSAGQASPQAAGWSAPAPPERLVEFCPVGRSGRTNSGCGPLARSASAAERRFSGSGPVVAIARQRGRAGLRWTQGQLCRVSRGARAAGRQTIFAPESRDAPVQILGPFEAAGLTFDALWFLGADDASWPAVARPHPFLTRSLQRTHNMPHADSTADWKLAQQVTTRLERSAAKCVFSYPSQNAEGACRPSTLVSSGTTKDQRRKTLRLSIGADEYLAAGAGIPCPADRRREQAAILPWPIEQDAGGAEILRRQAACPFQSFATRRLDARPMDATDWGLEARERGSVVHKILENLWAELKTRDALLEAAQRRSAARHRGATRQRQHCRDIRERALKHSWSQAYLDAEQERIVSLIEEWLDYEATAGGLYRRSRRREARRNRGRSKTASARGSYRRSRRRARDHRLQDRHAELEFPGTVRGRTNRNCPCMPASARSTI